MPQTVGQTVSCMRAKRALGVLGICVLLGVVVLPVDADFEVGTTPARQMEYLDRGLVAVNTPDGVYLSWRLLGIEPEETAFNVYRDGLRINEAPITSSTNYLDIDGDVTSSYSVCAVVEGVEQEASPPVRPWPTNYLEVPLQRPPDGLNLDGSRYTYSANDASVGDLTGDGSYEIVLKWDPSNSRDPSQDGVTGEVLLDAYTLDGTLLWRINLGRNIRAGAHYTPFIVYDLNGDGRAEVAIRTADGTVDGTGRIIGDPDADYRNSAGRVLSGPEYLTVFDGLTGAELVTVPFEPARGAVRDWGDDYGNRVDRFLAAVAYLDAERPSVVMTRGYYEKSCLAAYDYQNGELKLRWLFDSEQPGNQRFRGQGNHSLSVADIDGDGRDEIIYGAMVIDHDGTGLYSTGWGHGDALHVGDLDPNRPGFEVFQIHEGTHVPYQATLRDACTGELIWGVRTGEDTGRGMAADIYPQHVGAECWAIGGVGLHTVSGKKIGDRIPSVNFGIWWDGDLLRELLDHDWHGTYGIGRIDKWDHEKNELVSLLAATGTRSNNWTKGNPCLQADLFGDWREEVIWRTEDSSALRIYVSTQPSEYRIYTLMHDPVYRLSIAWQNSGYNQPPHTGFLLGQGMDTPPRPCVYLPVSKEHPGKSGVNLALPGIRRVDAVGAHYYGTLIVDQQKLALWSHRTSYRVTLPFGALGPSDVRTVNAAEGHHLRIRQAPNLPGTATVEVLDDKGNVVHTARIHMDVTLLPEIRMMLNQSEFLPHKPHRIRGSVVLDFQSDAPEELLGETRIELIPIIAGEVRASDRKTLYTGHTLPEGMVIDTLELDDGPYQLLFETKTVYDTVFTAQGSVIIDNWEEFVDRFLPPVESGWFGEMSRKKTTDESSGWEYAIDQPQVFFGDKDRLVHKGPQSEYLVWKQPALHSFSLTLYTRQGYVDQVKEIVKVSVSTDASTWYDLPSSVEVIEASKDGWLRLRVTGQVSGTENANYIRVLLSDSERVPAEALQLGEMRLVAAAGE